MNPSGKFWIIDRTIGPEEREYMELNYPSGQCPFAVFTSEETAWEYQKVRLGPYWEIAIMSGDDLIHDLIEIGVEYVVFDPSAHDQGMDRIVPLFEAVMKMTP
jgi:hypothetical protein